MIISILYLKNDKKHSQYPKKSKIINKKNLLLENINKKYFYYFKEKKSYYGFDIRELYYIIKNEKKSKNPYTNELIPKKIKKQVKRIIKRNKIKLNNLKSNLSGKSLISSLTADLYHKININSGCFLDIEKLLAIDKIYQLYFLQLLSNTRYVFQDEVDNFIENNIKKKDISVNLLKFLIELINVKIRKKEVCFIISEAFKSFYIENDINNSNHNLNPNDINIINGDDEPLNNDNLIQDVVKEVMEKIIIKIEI